MNLKRSVDRNLEMESLAAEQFLYFFEKIGILKSFGCQFALFQMDLKIFWQGLEPTWNNKLLKPFSFPFYIMIKFKTAYKVSMFGLNF